MSRTAALAVAALGLAAQACGGDRAERAQFEQVRRDCALLPGMTFADAGRLLGVTGWVAAGCDVTNPLGGADTCPGAPGSYTAPVCVVAYEYCAPGTSLCSSGPLGGCAYACEVRLAVPTSADILATTPICATRFLSGQPIGLVSHRPCQ